MELDVSSVGVGLGSSFNEIRVLSNFLVEFSVKISNRLGVVFLEALIPESELNVLFFTSLQ